MADKGAVSLDEVRQALKPAEQILALQAQLERVETSYREYKKNHGLIEQMLDGVLASIPMLTPTAPIYKPPKTRKVEQDISVVLHVTDAHYGAIQDEDEIEGFGKYSPEISRERQYGFVRDVLDWTTLHRTVYSIPEARFLVTGDLISGDIHDELRVTNAFPAPRQAVEAGEILAHQAALAAPHFEHVELDIITDDNHGRLTRKPQAKEAGFNNWMYVTASIAQKLLTKHKNVVVNIWPMSQKVVNVNGRRYLLTHGHDVMGWAGFPYYGIERRTAREALKRMNGPDLTKFDKIIMGHWHAPLEHPYYWIGGSVSGTDAYDHKNGRQSEPQQLSWMVHPKWGEFDKTNWRLTKFDAEGA